MLSALSLQQRDPPLSSASKENRRQTWRVRGVPKYFDKRRLKEELQQYLNLQHVNHFSESAQDKGDFGIKIHSLVPDLNHSQVATASFGTLPPQLRNLGTERQLSIELPIYPKDINDGLKRKRHSPQMVKVTIDDHFYGLTVLFSPFEEDHQLDIVAVSGLGSHAFGSFMNKRDGNMWLRDQLPRDMPHARVIIFGYRSNLKDRNSFAELGDLAGLLQRELIRVIQNNKPNRVVLAGHSLGGLLIKEALVQIADSPEEVELMHRIQGVIFFGVPNDGMKIESLIPIVTNQPNMPLVLSLRDTNSQILTYQKRNFSKILDKYKIDIRCFYELLTSPTAEKQENGDYKMTGPLQCLVSRASATSCLPAYTSSNYSTGLNKDHSNLVKFATHDDDFDRVRDVLRQVCQLSPHSRGMPQEPETQSQAEFNSCLKELGWTNPHDDRERIKVTKGGLYDDSFRWILEHREFIMWRDDDQSGLLWIKGNAGKGKTMLLIGISEELGRHRPSHSAVLFFFCQNSDRRLNNSVAILKGLIYLLLLQESRLISHLKTECDRSDNSIFEGPNAFYVLSRIFRQMIQDPSLCYPTRKTLFLAVDALDECESGLSDFCRLISETMVESSARLKWIVSSRNETRIEQGLAAASGTVCLDLEGNTNIVSQAIRAYINWKISSINLLQSDRAFRGQVERALLTKADDTFLWVALVIQELLEVEDKSEILAVLEDYPAGLDQIYERMLKQISELKRKGPEMCRRIISTAVFAYRPLHLHELHALSRLGEYNLKAHDVERTVRLCRSFLTVRKDRVYLIHQSAKDFLTDTSFRNPFPCNPQRTHYDLFRRSIEVMRGVLKRDIYDLILPGITIGEISSPDPDPLKEAQYACIYWIHHYCDFYKADIDAAAQNTPTNSDMIVQFLKKFLLNWLEALSLLHRLDDGVRSIRRLEKLLEEHKEPSSRQLSALIYECRRFLLQNKWTIEKAPLQTYVSALLFSPSESRIREIFRNEEPNWIEIKPRVENKWSRCLQTLQGHEGVVNAIAFSFDSRLLASVTGVSTIRLWDPETGAELNRWTGRQGQIRSIAFSYHNANLLASGSDDGLIRLWDLGTGTEFKRLEDHQNLVQSVIFSPRNPNLLASGGYDRIVRLWDLETGQILRLRGHEDCIRSVGFSNHNMSLLASGSDDGSVRVWDLDKGSTLHVLQGHEGWVKSVAFSDISRVLASASYDHTIRLWDSETGLALRTLEGHSSCVQTIAFSDYSHILASGSTDRTVRLWDTETGLELQKLEGHEGQITSVAFHNNSKVLASASFDGTIRFWDLEPASQPASEPASEPEKSVWHQRQIQAVSFSHDAKILASGSTDGTIRLWDPNTGSELFVLFGHGSHTEFVAFSYDSKLLGSVSSTRTITIWNPETGKQLRRFDDCDEPFAFSYNSKLLASGSKDGTILIWDLGNGSRLHILDGQESLVRSISFSFDSKFLVSMSYDETVQIWDPVKGSMLHKLELQSETTRTRSISFSFDSKLLGVEFYGRAVQLWNTETGTVSESSQAKRLDQIQGFQNRSLTVNDFSRIRFMGRDIIWLPTGYRPSIWKPAISAETQESEPAMAKMALVTNSGRIVVIGVLLSELPAALQVPSSTGRERT